MCQEGARVQDSLLDLLQSARISLGSAVCLALQSRERSLGIGCFACMGGAETLKACRVFGVQVLQPIESAEL